MKEAKAELLKILQGHPPDNIFVQALDELHGIDEQPETDLDKELNDAAELKDKKPAEYNKAVLALLKKAPLSKAASRATLIVNVTSEPAGADVVLNAKSAGKTPMDLT